MAEANAGMRANKPNQANMVEANKTFSAAATTTQQNSSNHSIYFASNASGLPQVGSDGGGQYLRSPKSTLIYVRRMKVPVRWGKTDKLIRKQTTPRFAGTL